jgi:hypothetical protein
MLFHKANKPVQQHYYHGNDYNKTQCTQRFKKLSVKQQTVLGNMDTLYTYLPTVVCSLFNDALSVT